jgi:hypothetical protein
MGVNSPLSPMKWIRVLGAPKLPGMNIVIELQLANLVTLGDIQEEKGRINILSMQIRGDGQVECLWNVLDGIFQVSVYVTFRKQKLLYWS